MARALSPDLDAIQTSEHREPGYQILIYDLRSTSNETTPTRINDVVLFNVGSGPVLPSIVGPRDFTAECSEIQITEVAGDYPANGVAASSLTFIIQDPGQFLDPVESPAPADGRWLRQGNVVVIHEGDHQVDPSSWPMTFTGKIQGQPGQSFIIQEPTSQLDCRASSREVDFLRYLDTSRNYLQGETFDAIISDLAQSRMGLDVDELNLSTIALRTTSFLSTQFVSESPLISIAKVLFPDGQMPHFEGDGRLGITTGSITKGPARTYIEALEQVNVARPILDFNGVNEVEILGLDPSMDQIIQQRQALARASITTGFFAGAEEIPVQWSDDKTQQAVNTQLEVESSIADGIYNFGSEDYIEFTLSDGGALEGIIEVDGGIGLGLAILAAVAGIWVAAHFIPDGSTAPGGPTVPIGRVVEGAAGQVIMSLLTAIGRGQYVVTGEPYEYVFREIRSVARVKGIRSEDVQALTVENHMVNSQADADSIAEIVLRRERAKQNTRTIQMIHDLKLEPDDVLQIGAGADQRRYMIQQIQRTLRAGGSALATLQCFEVTPGVRP